MVLLDGIYSTVIVRDILEREKRRDQKAPAQQLKVHHVFQCVAPVTVAEAQEIVSQPD